MARKKAPPAPPPPPTAERVAAALRNGDLATALDLARKLHAASDSHEDLAVRKKAICVAALTYADSDQFAEFNRVMTEAATLDPENLDWIAERAALLARGGATGEALRLLESHPEPTVRLKVLGSAADRALRQHTKGFLLEELHPGFDAITTAFQHYESGNDAAVREALEPIGLRSPFLEWKVLLRGLLAYADGDDTRAAEIMARLDPMRLPARLATPYRVVIDPAFKVTQPPNSVESLQAQYQKLTTLPLAEGLRAIARHLGRNRPLAPAFKAAEAVLPQLRHHAPHLVPRLANALYHAILQQGQPDDLQRYRKHFGNPPDDPKFDKLQAIIREAIDDRPGAHLHWLHFEQWLASNPPGWPEPMLRRARAEVWLRLGKNAQHAAEDDESDVGLFGALKRKKPTRTLQPSPEICFRRAVDLAPEWSDPVRLLFVELEAANKPAEAEAVARAYIARRPDDHMAIEALANMLQPQGRAAEAAELWLRILALNPLDKLTRLRTAFAILGSARRELANAQPSAANATLDLHRTLLEEHAPSAMPALRSVIYQKLGRKDDAEAMRARALTHPDARLMSAYRIMVDSQLAKLKPAEKKVADQYFAEEMSRVPTPAEVNTLLVAYDVLQTEGIAYRGQKSHRKKLLDLVPRCLAANAPEAAFETLGEYLVSRREWKIGKKYNDACIQRFRKNPMFQVIAALLILGKGDRPYSAMRPLILARQFAEAATEPRHRQLLDRIAELLRVLDSPLDFEDFFESFSE